MTRFIEEGTVSGSPLLNAFSPHQLQGLVGWWRADFLAQSQNQAAVSSPLSIGSVAGWWRADLGITKVGSSVTGWADQSGTGDSNKNLVGTGHAPTFNASDGYYNNQPTISFASASSQYLISGTWSSSVASPRTVFVVGNFDGTTNGQFILDSLAVNHSAISNAGTSTFVTVNAGSAMNGTVVSNAIPMVIGSVMQTSGATYVNGSTAVVSGTTGTDSLTGLNVGIAGNGTQPLNGKVCEIIVFSVALSTTQINQVNCYLSNRYAIPLKQSAWTDASGNSNTLLQATYGNQPSLNMIDSAYNNQPTLNFSSNYMRVATPSINKPYTVVVIGNDDGSSGGFYSDGGGGVEAGTIYVAGGVYRAYSGIDLLSTVAENTAIHVFIGIFNGVSSSFYVTAKTVNASGNTGANNFSGLTLGEAFNSTAPIKGKIAETIIYNRGLSQAEINTLLNYSGQRYKITIGS